MNRTLYSHSNYTERLQIVLDNTLRTAAKKLSKMRRMSLSELVRYWIAKEAGLLDKKHRSSSFNKALHAVSGVISSKGHPEWKNKKAINLWLRTSRRRDERNLT